MTKKFEMPEINVQEVIVEDVITTSFVGGENETNPDEV